MLFNRADQNGQMAVKRSPRIIVPPASEALTACPQEESPSLTVIGSKLVVQGNLHSADDVRVCGQVKGDIVCSRLTVAPGGTVVGNIVADEVAVRGTVKGIIRARK